MRQSLRKSINEMCRSCLYDQYAEGAWRQQIERCTSKTCPLYPVRPISRKLSIGVDKKTVLAESLTTTNGATN